MNISRRHIAKAMVFAASSCLVHRSYAQTETAEKPVPKPYRDVSVPADKGHIIFFFDFLCPFCAKYHPSFMRWAPTVPKSIRVSSVPVVNAGNAATMRDQIIAARCFFAAKELATPDQLNRFVSAVYINVSNGVPFSSQSGWITAVQSAGLDLGKFGKGISASAQLESIRDSAKQVALYMLDATPSVAIDGKYVVTPDNVGGNQEYFFTLINGLASKILVG